MIEISELTQNLLKELFDYRDGNLYWRVSRGVAKIGDLAGSINKNGYRGIMINKKAYLAHRLVFLYHRGYSPETLDHVDRNRSNNDIKNLREATSSQNHMNAKKRQTYGGKKTSSDCTGVSWNKYHKKWDAQIMVDDKKKFLGYYDFEEDACVVRLAAEIKYFGEFRRKD